MKISRIQKIIELGANVLAQLYDGDVEKYLDYIFKGENKK